MLVYLVDHKININKENKNCETLCFNVCKKGNEVLVKKNLIDHGTNINKI